MKVPLLDLKRQYAHMKADIDAAIARVLEHQQWILGPEVAEFEAAMARYLGVAHAVGVASGTDALVLALRALALQRKGKEFFDRDDEIITTPFTFVATADAILHAGATPVFADIDPATFNIDPQRVEAVVTSKTVGIIPVHLYGQPCEMERILDTARRQGLFVLEDVAQALGAEYKGKKAGSLGEIAAFSFFPSKNLAAFGDAGLVATADDGLAEWVRRLRKHGGKDKYNVDVLGYNSRLDTLQAAILLARLPYLDDFNRRRRALAARYTEALAGHPFITPPVESPESTHVYHQYTVRVAGGRRNALQEHLKENGIDSAIYYPVPLHRMRLLTGRYRYTTPLDHTKTATEEVLSLPMEPLLADQEIDRIIISTQGKP